MGQPADRRNVPQCFDGLRKPCSSFPRIEDSNSCTLKVGYIPGRDGQTVHQGSGCDEGVAIGARVRDVKRRASLGDGGVDRKDAAGECG